MRSFVFIGLQLLLFVPVYYFGKAGHVEVLLVGGALGLILYSVIAYFEVREERWFFSPVSAWSMMAIFHLGLIPIYLYFVIVRNEGRILRLGSYMIEDYIPHSFSLALLATMCFYTGAKLVERSIFKRAVAYLESVNVDYRPRVGTVAAIIVFSWIIYALFKYGVPLTRVGQILNYIMEIPLITGFIILISRFGFSRDGEMYILNAGRRIFFAAGAAAAYILLVAFGSGMRSPFLNSLSLFLWGYLLQDEVRMRALSPWVRAKTVSKITFLAGAAVALIVFLIVPYGKQFGRQLGAEIIVAEEDSVLKITTTFPNRGVWKLPSRLSAAIQGGAACILLSDYFPIRSKTVDTVKIGVIPRIFWPEKPFITKGAYFAIFLNEADTRADHEGTTATAMSAFGELYWSHGISGIIVGMTLLGLLYMFTYRAFAYNMAANPFRILIATSLVNSCLHWFEAEAASHFVSITFIWVVFAPLVVLNVPALLKITSGRRMKFVKAGARIHP